jgi:acyl-CoA thioester hydrolase
MSNLLLTARSSVYPWHCDHMGHMNVMWYVGKFDDATWHLFTLLGLTSTFLQENQRGMAAVQQEITYQRELYAGNVITIYSRVLEVKEKVIRFAHDMHNEATKEVAATTTITAVYLDTQLRKSCSLPPAIRKYAQEISLTSNNTE